MHIDSRWKFKEMIEFRDKYAKEHNWDLIVESNEKAFEEGVGPFTHGSKVIVHVHKPIGIILNRAVHIKNEVGKQSLS